ncbi:sensor domain-containing diguanylate cyclase [Solirubrobacter sp. CPCC 204708]|uniref:Sensor domain-containing diguanylate cyclase n=1 Tax=Solirubrobacter deserti TaxID=2282478 RepID=A0ABT4RFV8_9ACTN|nr:sensor domain-containing diguanylate cyclase [Solirubrobacter deserti]MBE2318127.1 sensor domain-containing diguanylate cyclase [Solirubrobacter deserti]MDA0137405.1 sensor domain-containing diguanylate cyclase [Solirubrobacter deserti]
MTGVGDPRRLAALAETGLLDGSSVAAFDRVTRLVAEVLQVPVALFTLVSDDRQVFKSSVGVGHVRETPLSHSFCKHVVESGAPLEVVDARVHPKVRDNPAVEELGVVAYLGMPLTTSSGERIGALCAIDHEPRQWTGRDNGVLEDLAGAAMAEVELRRANRAVAAAAAELHFAATHDTLTRLGNRRALFDDLGQLLADGHPASFALFDLHGMRGYNDRHGHVAGDALLARLGARLESLLVGHGHVYRLGGVQLCALMDAGSEDVVRMAAAAVADRASGVRCRSVTVQLPREAPSVAAVLRLADTRLAGSVPSGNPSERAVL